MKFSAIIFCLAAVALAAPSEMVGVTCVFQDIWRTGWDPANEKFPCNDGDPLFKGCCAGLKCVLENQQGLRTKTMHDDGDTMVRDPLYLQQLTQSQGARVVNGLPCYVVPAMETPAVEAVASVAQINEAIALNDAAMQAAFTPRPRAVA
ncbi:hypothetical protein CSOJ01_06855 [Colletotrichum sojae]|uniref:Uncharacterized protein n=1 Tax=Colletotrichum sojae TaxID=2175907 RepID=A0A8H6JAH4_9PEZI|nr:hypothetical protein CSOJ01_06855 [Colletotrichum sojae]